MLTFEQYLVKSVTTYPSLYASTSFELTKFLVSDYVFNTIGTSAESTVIAGKCPDTLEIPQHLIDGTEIFYVSDPTKAKDRDRYLYTELPEMTFEELSKIPGMDELFYFSTKNHLRKHPLSLESDGPYPNFRKRFSFVWNPIRHTEATWNEETEEMEYGETTTVQFSDLSHDWRDAAIEYYSQCLEYFKSDRCIGYWHAFNETDEKDMLDQIESMTKMLSRYGDIKLKDTQDIITKEYHEEFDGDVAKFLRVRWMKERQRIIKFIEETIEHVTSLP